LRPKKVAEERRINLVNIRLTNAEAEQFKAQAAARKMELGPYLRFLAMEDGERLIADDKIRRNDEGNWEVLKMGVWEKY
jgi:hypothetical protein